MTGAPLVHSSERAGEASLRGNLERHYNAKYGHEREAEALRIVAPHPAPQNRYEACLRDFPRFFAGGEVLEIGAGSGVLCRSLAAAGVEFCRYTATELSPARLDGLRRTLASDPRVVVEPLDLEEPSEEHTARYDAVILLALIEHLIDPLRALTRVRRMLRPGGIAYIDTPNIAKYTRRLKLLLGHFPATASREEGLVTYDGRPVDLHDEGHLHYFTYRSLSRLLVERCGFSEVTPAPYTTPPGLLGRHLDDRLARWAPGLFAELCVVARA